MKILATMKRINASKQKLQKPNQLRKCAWCNQFLPSEKYHLLICPDCRKATVSAFRRNRL